MIINFFQKMCEVVRSGAAALHVDARAAVTAAACALVLLQFSALTYALSQNVDVLPVVQAFDNDGANAISVAERSRWLTNNRFYPYGNLYFNLAHTVAAADPLAAGAASGTSSLESGRNHHFGLLFVSLCAVYGIAGVAAFGIARTAAFRLVAMYVLVGLFFRNEYWTTWVFRAHPDVLFSFFTALAISWTLRSLAAGTPALLWLSAAAWGLALATKLTAVTFLPALLLLFAPPVTKETFVKAIRYYGVVLISYLVIGFPQNFRFFGHVRFLRNQSSLSVAPTLSSAGETLAYLASQAGPLLIAVCVLALLARMIEDDPWPVAERNLLLKGAAMLAFPLAFLLAQQVLTLHEHYTLPLAASAVAYGTVLVRPLAVRLVGAGRSGGHGSALTAATAVLAALLFQGLPSAVPAVLAEQSSGRPEARAFLAELAGYQRDGIMVLADPYVPVAEGRGTVNISFYRTEQDLREGTVQVLALSRAYYSRYLDDPPSAYVQKDVPGWRDVQAFYRRFAGKQRTSGPDGRIWSKVHESAAGWEIWVPIGDPVREGR